MAFKMRCKSARVLEKTIRLTAKKIFENHFSNFDTWDRRRINSKPKKFEEKNKQGRRNARPFTQASVDWKIPAGSTFHHDRKTITRNESNNHRTNFFETPTEINLSANLSSNTEAKAVFKSIIPQ